MELLKMNIANPIHQVIFSRPGLFMLPADFKQQTASIHKIPA